MAVAHSIDHGSNLIAVDADEALEVGMRRFILCIFAGSFAICAGAVAADPTETIIYNYRDQQIGEGSNNLVPGPGGVLYGVSQYGGASRNCDRYGCGTIYQLSPPGQGTLWRPTILYSFTGGADGNIGYSSIVRGSTGVLYALTYYGGPGPCAQDPVFFATGCGTIVKLTPPSTSGAPWTKETIYSFMQGPDGYNPTDLAIDSAGALYGTAQEGDHGFIIFKMTPPAAGQTQWTRSTLYSTNNGIGLLTVTSRGTVYATTVTTVFALFPQTGSLPYKLRTLHTFTQGYPFYSRLLIGKDAELYGVLISNNCPTDCGTVFELPPPIAGQPERPVNYLYTFTEGDGDSPHLGVIGPDGLLYGTANVGGPAGGGVVFSLSPPVTAGGAWKEQTLHAFPNTGRRQEDGEDPFFITYVNGALYGNAAEGGPAGFGVAFKIVP